MQTNLIELSIRRSKIRLKAKSKDSSKIMATVLIESYPLPFSPKFPIKINVQLIQLGLILFVRFIISTSTQVKLI